MDSFYLIINNRNQNEFAEHSNILKELTRYENFFTREKTGHTFAIKRSVNHYINVVRKLSLLNANLLLV
jgi:hypothetical protein